MQNYEDFCKTVSFLSGKADDSHAKYIYEQIVCRDEVRIGMAMLSECGLPALTMCVKEIEQYCMNTKDCTMDLEVLQTRQAVGRMVREAMESMGYEVCSKGLRLPAALKLNFFQVASGYRRKADVSLDITLKCTGKGANAVLSHCFENVNGGLGFLKESYGTENTVF